MQKVYMSAKSATLVQITQIVFLDHDSLKDNRKFSKNSFMQIHSQLNSKPYKPEISAF